VQTGVCFLRSVSLKVSFLFSLCLLLANWSRYVRPRRCTHFGFQNTVFFFWMTQTKALDYVGRNNAILRPLSCNTSIYMYHTETVWNLRNIFASSCHQKMSLFRNRLNCSEVDLILVIITSGTTQLYFNFFFCIDKNFFRGGDC